MVAASRSCRHHGSRRLARGTACGRCGGRFTYRRGTQHQAWIAGGAGITPFLSWLRSLTTGDPRLRVYFTDTRVDDRLTPTHVLARTAAEPRHLSVFMCGPEAMLDAFEVQFRRRGVSSLNIRRERYDWR